VAELRCQDLAKSYGTRTVLSDVDLLVPSGTLTAILGASGSGKTTLLRLIIGFITPDRGRVSVDSHVVAEGGGVALAPDKRGIGYVAQEGALFPHLDVAENVAFGLPRAERKRSPRIGEVLELVGLAADYAPRRAHELSGGEQRRVALARALAPRPKLVLLDEPFSGLDAALRAETREAVLAALSGAGATAVLVTHDQGEALSMGREVAVLRAGRLVQTGSPTDVYTLPLDLDLAGFVGDAVVVPGRADGGSVECVFGRLPLRREADVGEVQVMIRPEQIRLSPTPDGGGTPATVVGHTYYGADTVVRLALEDAAATGISAKTFDSEIPGAGDQVAVSVVGSVVTYPAAGAVESPATADGHRAQSERRG
jgi:iron(III) transport system ATP-binding protein